ncbi:MAG TPA: ATP-binding protein [Planctomycetota bacterium]|nr:ATP-binding protein [Planctomycetota bacterium]
MSSEGIAAAFGPLLAALPEPAVVLDPAGKLAVANGLARALLAPAPGVPIEGKPLVDLIAFTADSVAALSALAQAPRAVELQGEVEARDGDAASRAISMSLGHVEQPAGYLGIIRDVTDARRREQVRITHEKLAAISQLAAGVAHEFNNIMASLLGFAQLARGDPAFNEELMGAVEQYADRSREITRRLRSFSPEQSGPLEAVSIPDLLDKVLLRFTRELETADIRVVRRYAPVPETLLNRREIEEVLESLVSNARHAIVKSGTISLDVRSDEVLGGGRSILVRVADTGYGIPKDNLTRVFEPFFTLKQTSDTVRPGAGLGLAVAYNYVRRHQGEIWAESEIGRGTCFTVRLPVRIERRRIIPPPPSPADIPVERRKGAAPATRSVLAVDDEEAMTKLLESILADHRVVTARSGREAMAALNRRGPFDYVILDLILPGELDGFEVFNEITKRDRSVKIILLTGLIEDEKVKDYAARAYGYLRKPFGIKDLSTLIV